MPDFAQHEAQKRSATVQLKQKSNMVLPDTPAVVQRKELSAAIQRRKEAMLDRFIPGGIQSQVPTIQRKSSSLLPEPVQNKMEATMGADFSNVNIHPNSQQAQEVGALAYTQGNDVHFAPGQFDPNSHKGQSLIGHELAHVVQQRQGRVQATTQAKGLPVNDDQGLEKEADVIGEKAAMAANVSAPAQKKEADGGVIGQKQTAGNVKQLYKQYGHAGETDAKTGEHWVSNGTPLRVAEDGTAAMAQARTSGGQELYVDPSRLPGINADLKTVKAPLEFAEYGTLSVEGAPPGNLSAAKKKLSQVKPVEPADHTKIKEIPDDCGNAARTVTGTFAEGKTLKAKYNDNAGAAQNTQSADPEMMKYEILVNHFGAQIPDSAKTFTDMAAKVSTKNTLSEQLKPYFKRIDPVSKALTKVRTDFGAALKIAQDKANALVADKTKIPADDPKKAEKEAAIDASIKQLITDFEAVQKKAIADDAAIVKQWQDILGEKLGAKTVKEVMDEYFANLKEYEVLKAAIMKPYNDQTAGDKTKFDQKVGINRFANPKVGESYTISSGGKDHPGESTWNYHWGGVVFKSTTGSDNVTMENYAGNEKYEWRTQIYGVPSVGNERKGQTFHEAHEATKQHGDNPTTMTAEKK